MRFKISYTKAILHTMLIEGETESDAINKFRQTNQRDAICEVRYLPNNKDLQEFYCIWWNGISWKTKVVKAHDEHDVMINIKDTLDYSVYDFQCCLNKKELIEAVHRNIWD